MSAVALRRVFVASLAQRRLATLLSLVAIALGVALGLAVQIIHAMALDEFGRGMRQLAGQSDLQVVGPRAGFDDEVYLRLAQRIEIAAASPVVEVLARLPGRDGSLRLYGVDIFRVAALTPGLRPQAAEGGAQLAALRPDRVFLSASARVELGLEAGDVLAVQSGLEQREFVVAGGVPGAGRGEAFGVIDIAAAQKHFERAGRLTRIDLRLAPDVSISVARERLAAELPAGVNLLTPDEGVSQTEGLSRAYRVNMSMLAAIALLTGGFLVFSAQWLAVVRRRQEFAFLRAIGMDCALLVRGLVAEGAVIGLVGGAVGVVLAYVLAGAAFALVGADLGAGYFGDVAPALRFQPIPSFAYLALGLAAGACGAWLPAREAARLQPAQGLHAGDEVAVYRGRPRTLASLACAAGAGLLCLLPPLGGVPVAGYVAVALILAAALLVLPGIVAFTARLLPAEAPPLLRLVRARLTAAPGQAVVAGAGVVASVALAVAMAVMVSSFRDSLDHWLTRVLPADLYVRASPSVQSGHLPPEAVARIAGLPGVASVLPLRYDTIRMSASFPMTLIARPADGGEALPLVARASSGTSDPLPPAWLSEAAADLLGLAVGSRVEIPLEGVARSFRIAGVWRDYVRQHGAIVVELADYHRFTADRLTNDLGVLLASGASVGEVGQRIAAALDGVEISDPANIRATSLAIFDRTFMVSYLMEAVAVLIGLFGMVTTFAALSLARRKEFGVLRHLGLERSRIGHLLAAEGAMTAFAGVAAGFAAGLAIAWVLIEVINRQSFHWSMDMSLPLRSLIVFAAVLVMLAALAARLAGAAAMRREAVLAVKEDW